VTNKTSGFGIGELGQAPESSPLDKLEAEHLQPQPRGERMKCDCGHWYLRKLVMSTSSGSSCPDCYDRMEDAW